MTAPFDRVLVIDFETAWSSKNYTLSKMTTEEYIRDTRFKAWGLCWKELGSDQRPIWVRRVDLRRYFAGVDWSRTAVLAHNAQFDVAIMEWHYNAHPCFIFDSLSMARALYGVEVGNSLAKLAERFGLPPKGKAVHSTDGMLDSIPFEVEIELADYCKHDTFLCEEVFKQLAVGYPRRELELIDLTLKMFTRPKLELDSEMLDEALKEEKEAREGLLTRLGVEEKALASNDQFAKILEALGVPPPRKPKKPTKKTPNPVGTLFAFAKSDALFQAMLNGDNEDVALLCEARLKVKSTQARTRAQRFLDISRRGALPVPLSYFGTLSMRWSASKGSSLNMQNLKRGSFLRRSIMAPEGYQVVVSDLSQIEPRVLAYVAGFDELLEVFRSGKDAYAAFGATMFNKPGLNKKDDPLLRQSAKSAMLGCFAAETLVLTNNGWKPIVQVDTQDSLWDGVEWVQHRGVVDRGVRETELAYGIRATSDHEILTELGWRGWSEVHQSPSLFQSARSLASLPASNGGDELKNFTAKLRTCINRGCVVRADGKGLSLEQTCARTGLRVATHAPSVKQVPLLGQSTVLKLYARIRYSAIGCSRASAQLFHGALIQVTELIRTTAGAVLACIRRGLQTARSFSRTSSSFLGGTTQHFNSIVATTNAGTCPATFASARAARTWQTNAESQREKLSSFAKESKILKQKTQTYDIAYAGPRNRYTILTDTGPIIVHNCGYYLGWASFAQQLLTGFLGAPPVRYDRAFARLLGITREDAFMFTDGKAGEARLIRMQEIPHTCSEEELFVHCVCAKRIIDTYRSTASPIVDWWHKLQELIESALYGGEPYEHMCLRFEKERILLPNGMALRYPDLQFEKVDGQIEWTYAAGPMRKKIHAGVLAENTTSALSRVVMTDGMLRIAKRYPVVLTVHDEVGILVPDEEVEEGKEWVQAQMVRQPTYLPGIPLGAETGAHRRYGLAKN